MPPYWSDFREKWRSHDYDRYRDQTPTVENLSENIARSTNSPVL